jgi:ketosteroid isomerase-like protein
MGVTKADELTGETSEACTTVERFIKALGARDLKGTLATYAPDAVWEVHVPGGDGLQRGVDEIGLLLAPYYIDRDGFDVAEYRILDRADTVALRCELHWLDARDGAPCVSHQSHFFEVRGGRIQRHWLYCSGVRVYAAAGHRHSPHGSTSSDPHEGR